MYKNYSVYVPLVAGSGHKIYFVRAKSEAHAISKVKKHSKTPYSLAAKTIKSGCECIYMYDSPEYEG